MATAKKTQIVITANAAVAKKVMDELQQRIDGIKQKMAALDVTTKQGQREFKKLEKELVSYNSAVSQNITNTERISKAMKNLSGTSLNELKRALSAAKSELGKMSASDKGLKQMQNNVKALQGQIDKLSGSVHKQSGAWQTAMKNLSAYVGMFALFNKAKELVSGAIKKNFEYSGSLTDIRKVSGMTMEEVNKLSTELAKIDTRTSVDGLAQLAYQGAKLGMGKYGVDGMAQFVKAADKINVALGEELGEEALPALSKMVEVMGLIPKMGIEKAMDATGSAMFKLSTTSTATSNDIVEFSKRLTGVARTAGITTDQLLALGSASSSMMLMPEVASTAMGKFIVALQKNHNLIAQELGIPDETIKNLYASGHAMDAIVLVLEKMRDKGNMNALGGIFKDLGSDGQRLVTAMVTMSKNVDMLKDHLYESEEAFREATAVTNEYEMQQQSAIGILERANNLWEKAFVNPDGVDAVKGMAEWWYEMSQTMTSSPLLKGTLLVALQAVLWALRAVATLLPVIIGYIASQGLYSGFRLLVQYGAAFGSAVKQMYAYVTAARTATAAQTGLNSAMKLNPWIALASVVIAVAGAVYGYAQQAKEAARAEMEAAKKANEWKNNLKEAQTQTDTATRKLHSYKVAMEKLNLSQAERSRQISQFNRDFRPYISKLGIEIKSVDDLRKNYKALAEEIQRATYYRLREKAKEDAMPKLQEDRLNAENRIKKELVYFQSRGSGFTSKGIMEMFANGANANWIYQQIVKGDIPNVDKNGITFDVKSGRYSYTNTKGQEVRSSGNQNLLSALRHYENATLRERKKEKEINDYFGDFVPEDYTPWSEETPGTLENDAPDKDAARQAKQEKRERERAWREELKQKQDEANAIMDNVRNFYERQINAKMQEAIGLGMDKTEQDLFVEPVKRRMNEALEQVRLAIAGQANTWEQFKLTMKDDLIEQTDESGINLSEGLLNGITSNNIDALREKLSQLGESLNRPLNSILAEVFAKATKNAQANLALQLKQQEARRKAIQEHDYTGVVQQNMYDTFNTMGYANPTKAEIADKESFDKRKANIIAMYEKARTDISKVFGYDMSNEEDRGLLMQLLFGDDPEGMGRRIAQTLGKNAGEWQAFYQKLIQYNDDYESASKKRDDERKKLNDYAWSKDSNQKLMQATIDYQGKQNKESSRKYSFGAKGDTILPWGQTEATDPELALLKLKFDLAKEYYKYIEAHNGTEEQKVAAARSISEAHDAIMDSVASKAKATAEAQMKWYKPIEKYGTALGEAMYDESKTVKQATRDMINSFIDLTGEYVQQKLTQWIMTKLYNSLMASSEQELVATKQAAAVENASTSVSEASVEVAAGTAAGSAKTIGELGWWGIPLVAVISAVLGGLLALAKGSLSNAFGGNKNTAKTNNIKVTSGMLTYDSGNVQGMMPYVSEGGDFYLATPQNGPHRGVSLLTQPTATTINGQPSLVAENGPEIVIGRETTRAMQMNNPQLLRALVNFDRNFSGRKAYDAGNLSDVATADPTGASIQELIANSAMANMALQEAVTTLMKRLEAPIEAKINMYGYGQLYESMKKAERFMRNK